ncbi:zinc ABC transporter substrate-binding protein AztC [Gordonia humi]|uniref:zinc ABC transporter substrate-binding protein AztC n=1 Tax=Gordonia humi TaxID=686429 RepID=UPI003609F58E
MPVALILVALTAVAAALAGCSSNIEGDRDKPLVVVTTNILGDVVSNIVGTEADVKVLMPRNADPHSFEISAADAAEISQADLFISNGLGLEEGITRTADSARSEGIDLLEVGEHVDPLRYGDGASPGSFDPHFWTDPDRIDRAAELIGSAVIEDVRDADTTAVRQNTALYRKRVQGISKYMSEKFNTIPVERRQLVTNHHVFGYLAERFDFTIVGAVVPSGTTLASPSASDLDQLAHKIRDARVAAIFVDSSQPDRLAQVLASEARLPIKVKSLHTESLDEEGTEAGTYLGMMKSNTDEIVDGLRS